jgi:hypothetical protein
VTGYSLAAVSVPGRGGPWCVNRGWTSCVTEAPPRCRGGDVVSVPCTGDCAESRNEPANMALRMAYYRRDFVERCALHEERQDPILCGR